MALLYAVVAFALTTMSVPQVRQRNPFKFASEISEVDQDAPNRILDEEEQERIVEELKKENTRLETSHRRLGVIVLSVSIFLQALAFLGITTEVDAISRGFNILHILLNIHGILILRGQDSILFSVNDGAIRLPPFLPIQLLVILQPILALFHSENVDLIQLSPPTLATIVAWVCLNAIDEGRRGVETLGGLMYEAKGA